MKLIQKPIPYGRQRIDADDIHAVVETLKSPFLTQGPKVAEFEAAVAKKCGARYAVACANGTAALHLAMLAAELGPGDEVVVPSITFAASANCASYVGATPVFADVEAATANLDVADAVRRFTPKTRAVVAVHFAGQPCDLKELAAAARPRKILIIEDAAHALGAAYGKRPIGSCEYSDMATLSFHPVKHITTGEGGMVLTNQKKLYDRLRLLRSHGITREEGLLEKNDGPWYYEMLELGYNYRICDIQCALGLSQLEKLDGFVRRRREIAAEYRKAFADLKGLRVLEDKPGRTNAYHLFMIVLADPYKRLRFFNALRARGIQPNVHYIPAHTLPYYKKRNPGLKLPNAERYYAGAVTLPIFPAMTGAEVRRVIGAVKEALSA